MVAKKVLLVGSFGVGKTSLIRRFVSNEFSEEYISTIGVRVSTKIVEYQDTSVKLLIWDVAGTAQDERIPKAYFLGASTAMYVFDLSREETYENLLQGLEMVKEVSQLEKMIVVGNKKDLLTTADTEKIIQKLPVKVDYLTSAKEDENVEDAFRLLGELALK